MKWLAMVFVWAATPAWANSNKGILTCTANWNRVQLDMTGTGFGHAFSIQDLDAAFLKDLVNEPDHNLREGRLGLLMTSHSCVTPNDGLTVVECQPKTVMNEELGFSYTNDLGDNFSESVTVSRSINTKNIHIKVTKTAEARILLDVEMDVSLPGGKTVHFHDQRQFAEQRPDNTQLQDWDDACVMTLN